MNADYFLEKSDACFALARLGREMSDELNVMGHALMAKAVELDAEIDKRNAEQAKSAES